MAPAALIVPDAIELDQALTWARDRREILQTNGRRNLIAPRLLPGFAQVIGGGRRQNQPDQVRA